MTKSRRTAPPRKTVKETVPRRTAQVAAGARLGASGVARVMRRMARKLASADVPGAVHPALAQERCVLTWGRALLPAHFGGTDEPSTMTPADGSASRAGLDQAAPAEMHRWLSQELQRLERDRGRRINVIGPRGHAKSTIVTLAYVLQSALQGREKYIWLVTETRHQARAHLDAVAHELAENQRLRQAYPGLWKRSGGGPVRRGNQLTLANGACIEAFGMGQRVRGRRYRALRPSLIVCDDLQSDLTIWSPKQREHQQTWFHGTLLAAGQPQTNVIHLGTALHRDGIALQLAQAAGWMSRTFSAVIEWPRQMQLWDAWEQVYANPESDDRRGAAREFYESRRSEMDAGAAVQWPGRYGLYELMCLRAEGGRSAFEREMQGKPVNPDLCEWPESYFDEPLWFDEWPARLAVKTLALDPSKGRDDRLGDFAAYVMLGVAGDGTLYVEADLARRPVGEMVARGVELFGQFRPDLFGVETNQFQELLAPQFLAEFHRQGWPAAGLCHVQNHTSKVVRIRRLGPLLSAKRLRFKARSAGTRLLVAQLREFPLGDHDDGPDALEMALRLAEDARRPTRQESAQSFRELLRGR